MSTFSFGTTQPQSNPTSLFGNSASTASKPALGGFTTPNPQQQSNQSTSLFGSAPANPSNSLFGSTTQQQQDQAPSTGLFGSTNQQQQNTGQTGGLFGSTNQNQNQNQQQQGGGLFGQQSTSKPGGLFVSTAQPVQGSSLFGQSGQTGQTGNGTGTGLGSSLFSNTGGGGLFGQQTQQQQQPPQQEAGLGNSLFANPNQQQPQPQSSLFGGFGQQSTSNQPQQGGLFGSTSQQPQPSLFSSTSVNPALGGSMSVSGYGQQAKQEPDIETRMMAMRSAWDQSSPDCRFKYFFYNVADPGTTGQYGRPAGANDDAKWAKAMRENPDRTCMVPVLATGWADVKKRVQLQENVASVHQMRIQEITQALSHLSQQTSLSSSIRLAALQNHLAQLMHRLIHLAALTPRFIPILQSTAFRTEEAEVKAQLEGVKSDLDGKLKSKGSVGLGTPRRGGQGRMLGQVNELWGQVEEIRRGHRTRGGDGREGWLGDEKALAEVAEILATQQLALQKLTDLLNNALFDADVIRQGLGMLTSERS